MHLLVQNLAVELISPGSERFSEEIFNLLCLCDREFSPPLSARESTTTSDFCSRQPEVDVLPNDYFEALKRQHSLIVTEGSKVVGFMSFKHEFSSPHLIDYSPSNYVSTLIVSPEHRGKGITEKLYWTILEDLPDDIHQPHVTTRTWSTNHSHLKILNKLDFAETSRIKGDRGSDVDTVYFGRSSFRGDKKLADMIFSVGDWNSHLVMDS